MLLYLTGETGWAILRRLTMRKWRNGIRARLRSVWGNP